MSEWTPKPGDWVVEPDFQQPFLVCEPPGTTRARSRGLWLKHPNDSDAGSYYTLSVLRILRPATPEEIAKAQLTSLEGL